MEAGPSLGGRLLAAAGWPFQKELGDYVSHLVRQVKRAASTFG